MFRDTFLFMCHDRPKDVPSRTTCTSNHEFWGHSSCRTNIHNTYTHDIVHIHRKSIFASIKDKQYRKQQEKRVKKVKNCVSRLVCTHGEELLVAIINNVEQCLRNTHTHKKSIYLNLDTKSKQEIMKARRDAKKITVLTTTIYTEREKSRLIAY